MPLAIAIFFAVLSVILGPGHESRPSADVVTTIDDRTVSYDFGRNGPDKTKVTIELKGTPDKATLTCRDMPGYLLWSDQAASRRIRFKIPVAGFTSARAETATLLSGSAGLAANEHPFIEFVSTGIATVPEKQNTYVIDGLLTARGKERVVRVEGTITELVNAGFPRDKGFIGAMIHLRFATTLRPSEFGIAWPAAALGDAAKDEVWIEVNVFGFTNDQPARKRQQLDEETFPRPQSAPTSRPAASEDGHE